MEIITCILSLLDKNKEVVVPTFGKFSLNFSSVTEDHSTGKVLPPQKYVAFEQPHKLNDIYLVKELQAYLNINQDEAEKIMLEEIVKWKNTLKNSNSLTLKGLGSFTLDKERITYEVSKDCIFNYRNYGLPELYVSLKDIKA
ncbi:hypothetical protein ETU08_02525 [Apibacter muscae]|uniref:HU domain-containing protein n=1 Tax=Apibacter muscae TaxID=2509004 RepID=UPI0011ADA126|nr:hypothetical protein [Apibacter muscae]TWP30898.1 hypothetical protein ETU08_02525 [Apibacter muscae]